MRTIERVGQFKRDYKRESKGPHGAILETIFVVVVTALAQRPALGAEVSRPRADRAL